MRNHLGNVAKRADDAKKDWEEKKEDWKSKLSGAFSSEQLFFSLFVLALFYVFYTIINGTFDINSKHQGDTINGCHCKSNHKRFYRALFLICSLLWFLLHLYTCIAATFPSCGNFVKLLAFALPKCLQLCILEYVWEQMKNCCKCKSNSKTITSSSHSSNATPETNSKIPGKIQHHIDVLWFQYYKLYVVGYAAKDDDGKIEQDQKDNYDSVEDAAEKKSDNKKEMRFCCCSLPPNTEHNEEDTTEVAEHCACPYNKQLGCCFNFTLFLNYFILFPVKYVGQLVTIPLLFLQIFDTYSLICFLGPGLFCSTLAVYRVHLAQAVITLLFYCSLALSQLASTMLTWKPWPTVKEDKE